VLQRLHDPSDFLGIEIDLHTSIFRVTGPCENATPMTYAMIYEHGLNEQGRETWSAYVPDLPGCVSAGETREAIELPNTPVAPLTIHHKQTTEPKRIIGAIT
jgi:hypothetical protein